MSWPIVFVLDAVPNRDLRRQLAASESDREAALMLSHGDYAKGLSWQESIFRLRHILARGHM
jgi:hypothetical protein